tara:strand:+ start:53342 stop:54181 length:840 start_codon:yes stop_codon:yes gene_type:complete
MKLWLTGVTTKGHEQDLKELIEPIKNDFDGLVWTFHYPKDEGSDYLESVKGDGEIIYTKWCSRLDFSRNHSLYQGPMRFGDWFLTIDTLERLSPKFTKFLKKLCADLNDLDIDGVFLHNKRLLFKLKENTSFINNPHEGITGCSKTIELSKQTFWDETYQSNVRDQKRKDPYYFIEHNMKYYLFPNSNHLVLCVEDKPDLINKRYEFRQKLINEVNRLGFYAYDIKSMEECFRNKLTPILRECLNFEKFLNDWYRYKILKQKVGIVNSHDFKHMKKIKF